MRAVNGSPLPSGSTSTFAFHGTPPSGGRPAASSACWASIPGGTRRLTRARACAGTAAAEPTTGGTIDPEHVHRRARPQHLCDARVPQAARHRRARGRRRGTARADTRLRSSRASHSRPLTVVLPRASRSVASIEISASSASGAGPPNIPEWTAVSSVSTVTTTFVSPRSDRRQRRHAGREVAGVRDDDRVGSKQIRV